MPDALSPKEIRWTVISLIGLLLISSGMTAVAAEAGGIDSSDVDFSPDQPEVDEGLENPGRFSSTESISRQKLNEDVKLVGDYVNAKVITEYDAGNQNSTYPNRDSIELEMFYDESNTSIALRPAQQDLKVKEIPVNGTERVYYYGTEYGEDDMTITAKLEDYNKSAGHVISYSVRNYQMNDLNLDNDGSYEVPILGPAYTNAANTFGLLISIFQGWQFVLTQAGWASFFIIAPMTAMSLIVLNTLFKLATIAVSAIPG